MAPSQLPSADARRMEQGSQIWAVTEITAALAPVDSGRDAQPSYAQGRYRWREDF